MASFLFRSVSVTARQSVAAVLNRSYTVVSSAAIPNSSSLFVRLRPLVAAASFSYLHRLPPVVSTRGFATRQTTSSLNDPNPNWSNRPPKETILLDGCDFEHWLVVMEKPEGDPTRDDIIDSYIKTLAMVVGSEEEARMKIYSVSTRHYFAFGALVSEELSYKLKELPRVRWVLPDSYLDVKNKDYGGEPFINGQAVPYDPKYHEEWVRNNARANERNKRNDRPRNFDRSRNFDRRREIRNQGPNEQGGNFEGQPGMAPPPPPNTQNPGMMPPNTGGQSNYGGGMPPQNPGNYQPNVRGPPNNLSGYQYNQGPQTAGRPPYQPAQGPNQQGYAPNTAPPQGYVPNAGGGYPYQNQNQNVPGRDLPPPPPPNAGPHPGYAHGQPPSNAGYAHGQPAPNAGYFQGQNGYPPNNEPRQAPNAPGYGPNQNAPGRDY